MKILGHLKQIPNPTEIISILSGHVVNEAEYLTRIMCYTLSSASCLFKAPIGTTKSLPHNVIGFITNEFGSRKAIPILQIRDKQDENANSLPDTPSFVSSRNYEVQIRAGYKYSPKMCQSACAQYLAGR